MLRLVVFFINFSFILATNVERLPVEVGCDGLLGSHLKIDLCGVCGGNGTTCRHVKGIFRSQDLDYDYHLVARIPLGAIRINFTESYETRSYLALRSGKPDGKFFINGDLKRGLPDPSRMYSVSGVYFDYRRPYQSSKGEELVANGPTSEELEVMLFFQGQNPGILYEYIIPLITRHRAISVISYQNSKQLPKSRPPLKHKMAPVHSMNHLNNWNTRRGEIAAFQSVLRSSEEQSPILPWISNQPSETRQANRVDEAALKRSAILLNQGLSNDLRITAWRMRGYGSCSKTCAGGIRTSILRCVRIETNEVVEDWNCPSPKPRVNTRKCNRLPCPAYYHAKPWSACSRTCGVGRRIRNVVCRKLFPGDFITTVSHKKCRGLLRPVTHERCQIGECPHWEVVGNWSTCNVQCGTGEQTRKVVCQSGDGHILPATSCPTRNPPDRKSCNAGSCITGWYFTDWEKCSVDCDQGMQKRNVFCVNTAGSLSGCTSRMKPNSTRTCSRNSCGLKYEWFAGIWSSCSSECGEGEQHRKVLCLRVYPDGSSAVVQSTNGIQLCDITSKPAIQRQCNIRACGARWHYTHWSECSVTCGGGVRTRDVQCLNEDLTISSSCLRDDEPRKSEQCNTIGCLPLQDPDCMDRSSSCSVVLHARFCSYKFYQKICCRTCSRSSDSFAISHQKY